MVNQIPGAQIETEPLANSATLFAQLNGETSMPTFVFCQLMTDVTGNPEEERRTEFYQAPWVPEAVGRYIYSKVSTQSIISYFLVHCVSVDFFFFFTVMVTDILFLFVSGAAKKTRVGAGVGYPTDLKMNSTAILNIIVSSREI